MALLIILATVALGLIGEFAVRSRYKKWSSVPSSVPLTGEEMARRMLAESGTSSVQINVVPGTLSDYFDPRDNTLNLSEDVAHGTSIAAHAIACHECGHYLQHAQGYKPLFLRKTMVPLVNVSQIATWVLLFIGIMFSSAGFTTLAVAAFSLSVIFSIVTLPVEFNASSRAVQFLSPSNGMLAGYPVSQSEIGGTRSMLKSAALTYVMAALASILNLVYILLISRS